jgi:recombination associated protein RdgC
MTWNDRVSFVLTDSLQLKKLDFLDGVFAGRPADDEGFDADAAIATGELRQLIPDLVEALGGELDTLTGATPPVATPRPEAADALPA